MGKIYVNFDKGVPQYICTECSSCSSLIGKSLCSVKERGCCWYFPKFKLTDIHRMVKTLEGLQVLKRITQNEGSIIYNYHIKAGGYFDRQCFEEYTNDKSCIETVCSETDKIDDKTIFFRACPFVKPGSGCTLPPAYRTFVCNFYVCRDIAENPNVASLFEPYSVERLRYSSWLDWENTNLIHILSEQNLTLISDFEKVVESLQNLELSIYEFPLLEPIDYDHCTKKGA